MCMYYDWKPTRPYRQASIKGRYKAGVVLINSTNEVLLVQNCGEKWSFPKGNVEPFEDAKSAAVRELREETGIVIDKSILKLTARYYKHVYFICSISPNKTYNTSLIMDKNEITGIGWFCIDKLTCSINLTRPTERILTGLHKDITSSILEV